MQVLVIFNQETNEVQVRGPWSSDKEADGAARIVARQHENDATQLLLAVVGVTPMVYYDPEVHK